MRRSPLCSAATTTSSPLDSLSTRRRSPLQRLYASVMTLTRRLKRNQSDSILSQHDRPDEQPAQPDKGATQDIHETEDKLKDELKKKDGKLAKQVRKSSCPLGAPPVGFDIGIDFGRMHDTSMLPVASCFPWASSVSPLRAPLLRIALTSWTVGILLGFIFVQPSDFHDFQTHLALLMDEFEITMPEFPNLDLPQLDLSRVELEWQRLWSNIPEPWKLNTNGLEFTVGEKIAERGLSAKHPVVLIPGIISTASVSTLYTLLSVVTRMIHRVWSHGPPPPITGRSSARRSGEGSLCSPRSPSTATNGSLHSCSTPLLV